MQTSAIEKPERWDVKYGQDMGPDDVEALLQVSPFSEMDPDSFPKRIPLHEILENDTRVLHFKSGQIVVREGDYGNSAFLILGGSIRVVVNPELEPDVLGRSEPQKRNIIQSLTQLLTNPKFPETRDLRNYEGDQRAVSREDTIQNIFLQDVPGILNKHKTVVLNEGSLVGEVAALSRIPRTATMFADSEDVQVLEIRWQGLRELMKHHPALRLHVEKIYRERTLVTHLRNLPLFSYLDDNHDLQLVADAADFVTYGEYDWSGEYKRLVKQGGTHSEPAIIEEGHYPNGVVLLKSGFARLCKKQGNGEKTLNYLSAGQDYGLVEIAYNWATEGESIPYEYSLKAIGYTHAIIVPTKVMEEVVLPQVHKRDLASLGVDLKKPHTEEDDLADQTSELDPELLEFLAANRFMNGRASMMINLDLCVRCDDCVRACAATHEGNPRFLRHGPIMGNVMIANACMHCADPVCMLGCPTGAIHRDKFGGQVVVNDKTCIGCGACAANCPFDAIRLTEIRDRKGIPVLSQNGSPISKATKCDLCVDQLGGPSCERACPHNALKRVDMRNIESLKDWLHL